MEKSPTKCVLLGCGLGVCIAGAIAGLAFVLSHADVGLWALPLTVVAAAAILVPAAIWLLSRTAALASANRTLRQQNDGLREASEAKTRFVANLSHELRNSLNAVLGFSELMHNYRLGSLASRQREHLGIIRGSAEHLLTLIDDALDLSRIEAGQVRIAPEPVEPVAIASACATALSNLSVAKGIHVELDSTPVGAVMIDPGRLRQVLLNYLSNAIKFSDPGSRVTITVRHEQGRLLLEVTDNGPGVDLADQRRIFDEFFQVPGHDRSGSGLGLAVTKLVVEAQGGEVGVRSIGLGSTFYASLPAPAVPGTDPWWPGAALDAPELIWPDRPPAPSRNRPIRELPGSNRASLTARHEREFVRR